MIKATLAALAIMTVPAHAGPVEQLIVMYAKERLCGTVYLSSDVNELVREAERRGMTYNEIRSKVVTEGKRLADRKDVSGDRKWFCR